LLSFQLPEGVPVAVQPESHADLMTREPDGFWRFAVALTLDRDAESFPKQQLAFFLRLKLHDGMSHVQLLDDGVQDFRIALARESEKQPLFDHMVAMVNRLLSAKPWTASRNCRSASSSPTPTWRSTMRRPSRLWPSPRSASARSADTSQDSDSRRTGRPNSCTREGRGAFL